MSNPVFFEDFSTGASTVSHNGTGSADPLEGYETGYKAGWDDAVKAQLDSKAHLSTVLTQNLEQTEFTLVEAQAEILKAVKPVLDEITATLLPGLSNTALRTLISEEISALLKEYAPKDISIIVSEQDESPVAALLNSTRALSEISLTAKATIGEGQAYISCASQQNKIDVKQAIGDIQKTIETFLTQPVLERADAV